MNNFIKKLINIFVRTSYFPRKYFDSILYLFLKVHNNWSILEKYFEKDILIVGNGPSLNTTPLDKIEMISIGMNKINLLFNRSSWRPNIIVCINGLVIKQNKTFINETKIPIVVPVSAIYLGIKIRPNILFIKIDNSEKFSDDLIERVGKGNTVTYTAFQIAAYMKAKSINIVGVDHSFTYKGNSNEISKWTNNDINHFDPNYFKDQLWGLPDLEGSERVYKYAKRYFDIKEINITDYTVGGKLTVFMKKDINLIC